MNIPDVTVEIRSDVSVFVPHTADALTCLMALRPAQSLRIGDRLAVSYEDAFEVCDKLEDCGHRLQGKMWTVSGTCHDVT